MIRAARIEEFRIIGSLIAILVAVTLADWPWLSEITPNGANGLAMSRRRCGVRDEQPSSSRSARSPGSASLDVPSGVESEVRYETCTSQKNDCDNDVHGYSSSNFAMADSMRVCSE